MPSTKRNVPASRAGAPEPKPATAKAPRKRKAPAASAPVSLTKPSPAAAPAPASTAPAATAPASPVQLPPRRLARIGARIRTAMEPPASPHETRGAGIVRPVVFGATDGLVCNLSLIMGVAGAAGAKGEDPHAIVIAGVAGLLAGGFSMAVGEYVSVRSQRELLEYQIDLQRHQLHHTPQQERVILTEIYEAKGLSRAEANLIVDRIMRDPERAIDTFVREEIGLSAETMGSPVAAGLGSLSAFAVGAVIPLLPFLILGGGGSAFALSIAASGIALFAIGLAVSRLTHRNAIWAGIRQAGLGGLAAAVTFGIGSLLGTAVH
jgi:VIT1/CCC1 family predicted Fe2+/Mn2+ transporter